MNNTPSFFSDLAHEEREKACMCHRDRDRDIEMELEEKRDKRD